MTQQSSSQNITTSWRVSFTALSLCILALCAVFWPVLTDMIRIWREDTTYNHGFLIAPVSVWLIAMRREELTEINPKPSWPLALLMLVPALIMIVGNAGSLALLEHFAFVGMLVCLIASVLGLGFAKKFWFPILFLFFMVPIGVELVPTLQYMTAQASVWLLRISGIPVFIEGMLIHLPRSLFEVAEACAGIRFLIANVVVATLFCYFCLRTKWKIILFLSLGVVIPILANFFRAYAIMMIAHYSNNELAVGVDHLVYGWVFFTFVMVILLWVGSLFADIGWSDPLAFKKVLTPVPPSAVSLPRLATTLSIIGVLIISAPLFRTVIHHPEKVTLQPHYPEVLTQNSAWNLKATDITAPHYWSPVYKTADATYRLDFEYDGEVIEVFIAWIGKQTANREIVHFTNRFDDDQTWLRGKLSRIFLPGATQAGLPKVARFDHLTTIYDLQGGHVGNKLVASWYWVNGTFTSNAKIAKLHQIQATLLGRDPSAAVIALAASFNNRPEEAKVKIERFMQTMRPAEKILTSMKRND